MFLPCSICVNRIRKRSFAEQKVHRQIGGEKTQLTARPRTRENDSKLFQFRRVPSRISPREDQRLHVFPVNAAIETSKSDRRREIDGCRIRADRFVHGEVVDVSAVDWEWMDRNELALIWQFFSAAWKERVVFFLCLHRRATVALIPHYLVVAPFSIVASWHLMKIVFLLRKRNNTLLRDRCRRKGNWRQFLLLLILRCRLSIQRNRRLPSVNLMNSVCFII